jgi:hypothetical protein
MTVLSCKRIGYEQNQYRIRDQRKKLPRVEHSNSNFFFHQFSPEEDHGKIVTEKSLRGGTGKNGLGTRIS